MSAEMDVEGLGDYQVRQELRQARERLSQQAETIERLTKEAQMWKSQLNDAQSDIAGEVEAGRTLTRQLQEAVEERDAPCDWLPSEGGDAWATSCGNLFQFYDGGPLANSFTHCPYCGGDLTEDGIAPPTAALTERSKP